MEKTWFKFGGKLLGVLHRLIEYIARWMFLMVSYFSGPAETAPPIADNSILLEDASALAIKIRLKKIKSETVVTEYISRIKQIQPILNCIVEDRFEAALEEARKCDEFLNSSECPSVEELAKAKPFFGVPFTTKDTIAVKGMKHTAGLVSRKDTRAEKDADAIRLLREAGAIPLAITNVSELAMWWESSNYLYGTTRNPYNTWHIVGGSSGGEGCIQAAGGSPFGIGSDIGGSIRMPSFFNGIFGHKPSKSLVSNDGQFPSTQTKQQNDLLAIGPMSRFARDLKPILKVISGKNVDKLKLDEKVDIATLKFYYMEDDGGQFLVSPVSRHIKESLKKFIWSLEKAHKIKATRIKMKKMKKSLALWFANMTSPPENCFATELANRKGKINLWLEFFKWATFSGNHTLIALVTAIFEKYGIKHDSQERMNLLEQTSQLFHEFQDMLKGDGVFLYPVHPTPAPLHHEPLIKPFNFSYTAIINCLGLPATSCPLGFSNGLPIGIQVIAGLGNDHLCLAVAEEIERSFGGWQQPATVL